MTAVVEARMRLKCAILSLALYTPIKVGINRKKGTEEYNFITEPSLPEKQARSPMFERKESML